MKIHKSETVVRYQVSFTPGEIDMLRAHKKWWYRIGNRRNRHGSVGGDAVLTKSEINEVCDVLGVNGREFLTAQGVA